MKFPTHAVLSTTSGKLMGDIDGVYSVMSFLIGRDAFTHELVYYAKRASAALRAALPELPDTGDFAHVNRETYKSVIAEWESRLGAEIDIPDSLRDVLADDRDPVSTAGDMVGKDRIIVIR